MAEIIGPDGIPIQLLDDPKQGVDGNYWFTLNGVTYFWSTAFPQWRYFENGVWNIANWQHVSPMYPFGRVDSDAVKGKPLHVWDFIQAAGLNIPTSSSIASHHLDCRRWLRVATYLSTVEGFIEIPLLDANNVPWLSPERPWNVVCRWCSTNTSDNVTTPGANDLDWTEAQVCVRPGANVGHANENYSVEWSLHPVTKPVPHWLLRVGLTRNNSLGTEFTGNRTVLIDIVGTGYGLHSSASREVSGGVGVHWKATLMWTQQGFLTTPSLSAFNERKLGVGVVHAINKPDLSSPGTIYLTTGVNEGLSSGTALFTELPMVQVFGHAVLGVDVSNNASTNWRPQSWGMGVRRPSQGLGSPDFNRSRAYFTRVRKDSVSGHYRVQVFNVGSQGTTETPTAAFDRTFFVYALGK